jgi:putative YhbY family RNA-binding protein
VGADAAHPPPTTEPPDVSFHARRAPAPLRDHGNEIGAPLVITAGGEIVLPRRPLVVSSGMESPASQKKRSLMPSGKLRRSLRAHGHALAAVVQIGKGGVTSSVIKQINQALADHELIKVKIGGESPVDRFAAAERLAGEPGVSIVQIIGRVLLLYKRHPQRPRFEGKRAAAARDEDDDSI